MRIHVKRWGLSLFMLLYAMTSAAFVTAAQGWASFESQVSGLRSSGWTRVSIPITGGDNTLIFLDAGALASATPTAQASIGIGLRRQLNHGLVSGTYAFYDRGISATGHSWDRITLGYELLSPHFDLHINGYFPDKAGKLLESQPADAILVSGTDLLFEEANYNTYEQALTGFDVELGRQILGSTSPTRAFMGAYFYHAPTQPHILGLRMGIEAQAQLQWQALPGASLTAKLEGQHDAVRGTQGRIGLELRFPFGRGRTPVETSSPSLLLQPVHREIDIVTQVGAAQREVVQTTSALHPVTHEPIERVWVVTANGSGTGSYAAPADIEQVKANAGSHDLILILGDDGAVDTGLNGFIMQPGQIVAGAGSTLTFLSGNGREAEITFAGTPGRLTNTEPGHHILTLADHGTVVGLTFEGGDSSAIYGQGITGVVRVRGNTLIDVGAAAIDITAGTSASSPLHLLVEENVLTNTGAEGIRVVAPLDASLGSIEVAHNVIDHTQGTGVYIHILQTDSGPFRITNNHITNPQGSGIHTLIDLGSRLDDLKIEENTIVEGTGGSSLVVSILRGSIVNAHIARNTLERPAPQGIVFNVDVSTITAIVEENLIIEPGWAPIHIDAYASHVDIQELNNQLL